MEIIYTSFIHPFTHSFIHHSGLVLDSRAGVGVRIAKAQVHAPDFQIGKGDKKHTQVTIRWSVSEKRKKHPP